MEKRTFCRICEAQCGVLAKVENDKIVSIRPDGDHPLSEGHFCVRGGAFPEIMYDPDRVTQPQVHSNGGWENLSWDRALGEISEKLKAIVDESGPDSAALYLGNPNTFGALPGFFANRFFKALNSTQIFSALTVDCVSRFYSNYKMIGRRLPVGQPDYPETKYILMLGSNPVVSHFSQIQTLPNGWKEIEEARENGAKLVVVDPRRTETAEKADEHIFIKPTTDLYFLMGVMSYLLANGWEDKFFIEDHCANYDRFKEVVDGCNPEMASMLTGVPVDTICRIAGEIATSNASVIVGRSGLSMSERCTLADWMVLAFNAITGNWDRPGGHYYTKTAVFGALKDVPPDQYRAKPDHWVRNQPSFNGEYPVNALPDAILNEGPDGKRIRALFVQAGNPVLSCPNGSKWEKALQALDLLVVIDIYRNDTAVYADYLLPTPVMYERKDAMILPASNTSVKYAQYTDAIVDPPEGVMDEVDIYSELFGRMNLPFLGNPAMDAVHKQMREQGMEMDKDFMMQQALAAGVSDFGALKETPGGIVYEKRKYGHFFKEIVNTADKKIDLAPEEFVRELNEMLHAQHGSNGYSHLLITKRHYASMNSWMHNSEKLRKNQPENRLEIHPNDAAALGLEEGSIVRVASEIGEIELPIEVTDRIMPGVVATAHGWGHHRRSGWKRAKENPGANMNRLAHDEKMLDPFTGMPRLNGIPVGIQKAQ